MSQPSFHLGEAAAALVDGELSPADRERALAHIAGCDECRSEVDAQRKLKARLRSVEAAVLPPELLARLQRLPGQQRDVVLADPGPVAPRDTRPRRRADAVRPYRRRRLRRLVGSTSVALGAAGIAVALGGSPAPAGETVHPPVPAFVEQHGVTTVTNPFTDPAVTAVTVMLSR